MKPNFKINIIICIGKMRVGKDTLGKVFISNGYKRMAFADRVKELAFAFGWDGNKDEKGRKLLQQLGTDVGRTYNQNIWIDYLKNQIKEDIFKQIKSSGFIENDINIVITDGRFINEITEMKEFAKQINAFFGYEICKLSTVKIIRNYKNDMNKDVCEHLSESELDNIKDDLIDYTIINDSTLKNFETKCIDFFNELNKK